MEWVNNIHELHVLKQLLAVTIGCKLLFARDLCFIRYRGVVVELLRTGRVSYFFRKNNFNANYENDEENAEEEEGRSNE